MTSFVRRLATFGSLVLLAGVATFVVNLGLSEFHNLELSPDVDVLFVGDSHIAYGVDPDVVRGARNVALRAEPMSASRYKVEGILDANPDVRTVVLGFGAHNLTVFNELEFTHPNFARSMADRYVGFIPWRGPPGSPFRLSAALLNQARWFWTPNPHLLGDLVFAGDASRPHEFAGSYLVMPGEPNFTEPRWRSVDRHLTPDAEGRLISEVQIRELRALSRSLADRGVRLVLLSTPVRPRVTAALEGPLKERYDLLWDELTAQPHVDGWDFSAFLPDPEGFADFDHLSANGAHRLSVELDRRLRGQ